MTDQEKRLRMLTRLYKFTLGVRVAAFSLWFLTAANIAVRLNYFKNDGSLLFVCLGVITVCCVCAQWCVSRAQRERDRLQVTMASKGGVE